MFIRDTVETGMCSVLSHVAPPQTNAPRTLPYGLRSMPLVTWLTLPQPGPALVAEDGGNEMVTREYFRSHGPRTALRRARAVGVPCAPRAPRAPG
eukprot:scaffold33583_cov61-Phaeocystis_antarctica.AAC.1